MKHRDVFEPLEPPPHGLTRLRAGMEERRARRVLWPVLATSLAVAVLAVVLWPREETPRVDFSAAVTAMTSTSAPVQALGETGVEPLRSSNPDVVVYRAFPSGEQR
jgi:hypothetical protein